MVSVNILPGSALTQFTHFLQIMWFYKSFSHVMLYRSICRCPVTCLSHFLHFLMSYRNYSMMNIEMEKVKGLSVFSDSSHSSHRRNTGWTIKLTVSRFKQLPTVITLYEALLWLVSPLQHWLSSLRPCCPQEQRVSIIFIIIWKGGPSPSHISATQTAWQ